MDLDSLIEAGNAYRQNPLTDFKGEPVWIASIYREDYFQWIMKALTFLQNEYGDTPLLLIHLILFHMSKNKQLILILRLM